MPSEQELEQTNSDMDNDVLHPIIPTPNWWPLKSMFTSGSSNIFLSPGLALLLLLCAAVR
jgi:hypothetical protein